MSVVHYGIYCTVPLFELKLDPAHEKLPVFLLLGLLRRGLLLRIVLRLPLLPLRDGPVCGLLLAVDVRMVGGHLGGGHKQLHVPTMSLQEV